MRSSLLRGLMLFDALVLLALGGLLVFAPVQIAHFFKFPDLPAVVNYLLGLWGCALVSLGCGYFVAARHPVRQVIWIQIGIARGVFECAVGLIWLARGLVTWPQVGFGVVLAGLMAVAYLALYPRGPRIIAAPGTSTNRPT